MFITPHGFTYEIQNIYVLGFLISVSSDSTVLSACLCLFHFCTFSCTNKDYQSMTHADAALGVRRDKNHFRNGVRRSGRWKASNEWKAPKQWGVATGGQSGRAMSTAGWSQLLTSTWLVTLGLKLFTLLYNATLSAAAAAAETTNVRARLVFTVCVFSQACADRITIRYDT